MHSNITYIYVFIYLFLSSILNMNLAKLLISKKKQIWIKKQPPPQKKKKKLLKIQELLVACHYVMVSSAEC